MTVTILWFRQDLRLSDNPALVWAAARGKVLPVYVHDETAPWAPGGASRWWLHHALDDLQQALQQRGLNLLLRKGNPAEILPELAAQAKADAVCWNRCYEPHAVARDTALKAGLRQQGLTVTTHNSALLFEPWEIKSKTDAPYRVFTPYYKACLSSAPQFSPLPVPQNLTGVLAEGDKLSDWHLLPSQPDWARNFSWDATTAGAERSLENFIRAALPAYKTMRDRPDISGTSRLSPYLHFGQISPRQIWQTIQHSGTEARAGMLNGGEAFLRELIWREFCHHLLFYQPQMPEAPLQANFQNFPWQTDKLGLKAWQRGQTGFPIVDAGMRQLWQTGWMHNRVRMIVASFLVKDLLIPWQEGERWFWDTLVDADLANNAAGWQWVAGCGADAAPYYRIFNPLLQSQKFDPEGAYIRHFVPELRNLPLPYLHEPASAPPEILHKAGVILGKTYPAPIIDHRQAKERALAALMATKEEI